ncbi:hypothetical protein [Costertonia aggregata]|uniref:DUF378 domain-containing protein n=1 Tax=Costertonia aggregata TaxID=343403 RepID=A0A7H9APD6_9FLAO|nr:hypothetical protein [Costertonia aggregata]QLG45318.1 hypothetical protein HYG79_08140 [Costertonia aggregata]
MKKQLSGIGSFMALAGIISTALSFFNYNLRLLTWIDMWGETVGWIIRIGLIVVGAALFFAFKGVDDDAEEMVAGRQDKETE